MNYVFPEQIAKAREMDLLTYVYTSTAAGKPSRVKTISEHSGSTAGNTLSIAYAHNQTKFTDNNGNVQIVQFNNWGNTVSVQDDLGRAQYARYAFNDAKSSSSSYTNPKGNQLRVASKLQNTVGNMLMDSSFENSRTWSITNDLVSCAISSSEAYHGSKSLELTRPSASSWSAGVYNSFTAEAGATYTFSAYVKTGAGAVFLEIGGPNTGVKSETVPANSGWTRLEISYTNTSSSSATVYFRVMTAQAGVSYIDCVQLEKAPTASRYNLIENGDFRYTTGWSSTAGLTTLSAAAPELQSTVYKIVGSPTATKRISQTVKVSGSAGDTFVLAGWAKADSVPLTGSRQFAMIATFKNGSTTVGTSKVVQFNPDADSSVAWQYAADAIVATGAYTSIVIELAYDYNANTAYFDGIQLFKEEFGSSYSYDGSGNVTKANDVQGGATTYTYNTNNDLTKVTLPDGSVTTYTYDSYHNVKTAKTNTGVTYNLTYDTYGNDTKVSITSGSVTLSSSATYTSDGNRLATTTDTAGNTTTYTYGSNTNVLSSVKYPKDTDDTKTTYSYDDMYRLISSKVTTDQSATLSASYTYTNDLLASLRTGSTTYTFTYGTFSQVSSITAGINTLATYTYTFPNNYLDTLAYGNGDSVKYSYDRQGRVTKQTYEDGDTVTYKYDNNGDLATVTDSETGVTTTYYYDFAGRLMKYAENDSAKHSVIYAYDEINNLTSVTEWAYTFDRKIVYGYDQDNRVTSVSNGSISESYTYDAYNRISSSEAKYGSTTVLTEKLTYRAPTSAATTGQVSKHVTTAASYNLANTYTYDSNGNILSVSDGTYTTSYVYDSANQLIRENNQAAGKTWTWTYDDAGNITSRNEYAYTTGTLGTATDTAAYSYAVYWGDLLKSYDGRTFTNDLIGNITSDGIRTYTWQHGRELATVTQDGVTWTNTYNADGLRSSRSNGSVTTHYFYMGDQLSQIQENGTHIYFTYDSIGRPMMIRYQGTNFYYVTNIQGDVVAILNTSGSPVVKYTYDAWGNVLSVTGSMASTLGEANPLRYRGYVYDTETGLYYVSSRYYDPEIGRWINADALVSTGQGLLGNNMFAYCVNNPVNMIDPTGQCSYFLFFKKDCFTATCPDSQCYNPDAPNVVVIYDGRFSGYFGYGGDHGFEHQASELCRRLAATSDVTSYAYTTVDDFVDIWNGLNGSYDTVYIVGHGYEGELRFKGGRSIAAQNGDYSFSDLDRVSVDSINLYACHGATIYGENGSIAMHLSSITGASVCAVKDGKLNFTWYGCFPIPARGGYWVTVP